MTKKLFISFLLMVTLSIGITVINPSGYVLAHNNNSGANIQASTPTPEGQIEIPAVKVQFYSPGTNPLLNTADSFNRISGFLHGIWHGAISPGTLIMSFLNPNIQMYEVHNNGGLYNLGFLIGVGIVFLVLGLIAGSRRRRRL